MKEYRSFTGELRLLESNDPFLFPVEIWLLNDAVNRNNWQFTDMAGNKDQFAGTPVLIAYINGGTGIGDGHNQRREIDPKTGQPRSSFTAADAERIVGAISDDPDDIRLEVRDGNTWIVGKGFLWAWYAPELVEKIERDAQQGRAMSVSIETLITKEHMEGSVAVEDEYIILGTTILGDHVQPAVEDAHIAMLSSLGEEFKELKLKAASYREPQNKPQAASEGPRKNLSTRGLRNLSYLSKQQIKELQTKFGDAYTVLSARKDGDKLTVLLVRDEDAAFGYYIMTEGDTFVETSRIIYREAEIYMELEEGDPMVASAYEYVAFRVNSLAEQVKTMSEENGRLDGELKTAQGQLTAMREAEGKRRLAAAKEAAKNTLDAFNANRADKVEAKVLEAVNADIEGGVYAGSVDADGNWTGEQAVSDRVLALCAAAVMKLDAAAAQRGASAHIWDKLQTGAAVDDGSVMGLLARKGIE